MKGTRNYKGIWIPKEIWENLSLSAIEKVLFADIASMITEGLEFFKSNERIASDLKCSESTAKRAVASLKRLGLIEVNRHGRRRFILLSNQGKTNLNQGHLEFGTGQNSRLAGSSRPYSSTGNKSFMNSLYQNNLDIYGFEAFKEDLDVQDLMAQWASHRVESGKPLTVRQREMAFENLYLVSLGDVDEAQRCVEEAMIGGWSKFFQSKHQNDQYY